MIMKAKSISGFAPHALGVRKLRVSGLSLATGAVAFLSFWFSSSLAGDDVIPWSVSLVVHGMSILLLSIGLITAARNITKPIVGSWVTRAGAGVAIIGLLTVFPLIPVGFGIFGIGLVLAGQDRLGGIIATTGSAILLGTVILGARAGMEGAPELSDSLRFAFQVSVFLIAAGLFIIGIREKRRVPHTGETR